MVPDLSYFKKKKIIHMYHSSKDTYNELFDIHLFDLHRTAPMEIS